MLHIDIVAIVPELLQGAFEHSIIGRAKKKQLVNIQVHNLRDYSVNKHNKIDDYVFGGGAGMLIQIEPVDRLISHLKSQRTYDEVIYMSPDGELLDQNLANGLSLSKNLILLCPFLQINFLIFLRIWIIVKSLLLKIMMTKILMITKMM